MVAALTLPTLIQNYQKKQTVVQLQKNLALLQQAVKLSEAENGESADWGFPETSAFENAKYFAETLLFPYLKVVNSSVPATDKCWSTTKTLAGNVATLFAVPSSRANISVCANLSSGSSIYLWTHSSNNYKHAQIWIDINGHQKGPNVMGKDVFGIFFDVNDGRFRPLGKFLSREELLSAEGDGCNKNNQSTTAGTVCTALIMMDGWEIKDDYPW